MNNFFWIIVTHTFQMAANSSTGVLDSCKCRVSIRKEEKGGKNFRKVDLRFEMYRYYYRRWYHSEWLLTTLFIRVYLSGVTPYNLIYQIGFVDLDLAEYAGAGPSTQRYILQVQRNVGLFNFNIYIICKIITGVWHKSSAGQFSSTDNPQHNSKVTKQS